MLQKLAELVQLLVPKVKPQHDASTLEKWLSNYCNREIADASPMGRLLMGPSTSASDLPMWSKAQLATQRQDLMLPNKRAPSVGCKQVSW